MPVSRGRFSAVAIRPSRDLLAIAVRTLGAVGRTGARDAGRTHEDVDGGCDTRARCNRRSAEVNTLGFCLRVQDGDFECCARHSQPKMRDRRRGRNAHSGRGLESCVLAGARPSPGPWRNTGRARGHFAAPPVRNRPLSRELTPAWRSACECCHRIDPHTGRRYACCLSSRGGSRYGTSACAHRHVPSEVWR